MKTHVSHAAKDGSDFETGLRAYFSYRDTCINEATGGAFTAHVIRAVPGKTVKPLWHYHTVGFQMYYVLQGWIEFEYEDIGVVRVEAGGTAYQPSGVRHRELAHSDDLELLEIISPAKFETHAVNEMNEGQK